MILNYTDYPICETFHSGKGNFFIQTFINTTQQIAGEVVESCERSGDFRVWNMSFMNTTMLSLWPAGSYRVAYKFTDGIDSNIVNLTFEGICLRWFMEVLLKSEQFSFLTVFLISLDLPISFELVTWQGWLKKWSEWTQSVRVIQIIS